MNSNMKKVQNKNLCGEKNDNFSFEDRSEE